MQRQVRLKIWFVISVAITWAVSVSAGTKNSDQHIEVSMRMIGHQILLQAGDTVSRVLPVQKELNGHVIRFEKELGIDPERMTHAIDSVIAVAGIAENYIVEVKACGSGEIVYSYEKGGIENPDIVPCKSRALPVGCYALYLTLNDGPELDYSGIEKVAANVETAKSDVWLWLLPLATVLGLLVYFFRHRRKEETQDQHIAIGEYRFNPKAMTLAFQSECIELTGKESELLYLLYLSANSTVERELILEKVWGDQGDYVGRTLDVFISKLRKKLEADSAVQIKNIRGVGYKLVLSAG